MHMFHGLFSNLDYILAPMRIRILYIFIIVAFNTCCQLSGCIVFIKIPTGMSLFWDCQTIQTNFTNEVMMMACVVPSMKW